VNRNQLDGLHQNIARMAREFGTTPAEVLSRLVDVAVEHERHEPWSESSKEPDPAETAAAEVCTMLNVSLNEYQVRADHLLSSSLDYSMPLRTDPPVRAGHADIANPPVGQPKYLSPTLKRSESPDDRGIPKFFSHGAPQPSWRGDDEDPSTSGTDEYSSLPDSGDSVYLRRKFLGRSHFGGFKSG
jgi:hypothetical protein